MGFIFVRYKGPKRGENGLLNVYRARDSLLYFCYCSSSLYTIPILTFDRAFSAF